MPAHITVKFLETNDKEEQPEVNGTSPTGGHRIVTAGAHRSRGGQRDVEGRGSLGVCPGKAVPQERPGHSQMKAHRKGSSHEDLLSKFGERKFFQQMGSEK